MTLSHYIASCRNRPFNWPDWTCCHFAAGWAQAVTGAALLPMLDVGTARDSQRAWRRHGVPHIVAETVGSVWPRSETSPRHGDVVVTKHRNKPLACVAIDRTRAFAVTASGLAVIEIEHPIGVFPCRKQFLTS